MVEEGREATDHSQWYPKVYIYMNDRDGNTCDGDIINDLIGGLEHSGVIRWTTDFPGECEAHTESECEGVGCRVVQQWGVCGTDTAESTAIGKT